MVNLYKVKKMVSLLILGMLPTFAFFMFMMFNFGIIYSIVVWVLMVVIGMLIFSVLTRHPLMSLIQGEGMLGLTFDSTGVIEPFLVKVNPPFIKGFMAGKKQVSSLFDRNAVFYMKNPQKADMNFKNEDEDFKTYTLKIPKGKESQLTYMFQQYPTFIFNKNLDVFLTKDSLAKIETEGMIKHLVLYLKVKTEELTSIMRDFARYVIEMTKPKQPFLAGKGKLLMIIAIIVAIIILIVLFAPSIINIIGPALNLGTSTVSGSLETAIGTVKPVT